MTTMLSPAAWGVAFFYLGLASSLARPQVSNRLGLFIEVFGAAALSQDRKSRLSYQGGMTFLLTDLFQVDVRAGVGLLGNVPDWLAGTGFGFRFPR